MKPTVWDYLGFVILVIGFVLLLLIGVMAFTDYY